jgi:hypothetical protein
MRDRRTNDRQRLRSQRRELHSRGWTTGGADYNKHPPHSQSLEIPLHAARVRGASGTFTVITDLRLSPACTARATAQRGQRRTADLIPDWLTFPTASTLHRGRANRRVNNARTTRRLTCLASRSLEGAENRFNTILFIWERLKPEAQELKRVVMISPSFCHRDSGSAIIRHFIWQSAIENRIRQTIVGGGGRRRPLPSIDVRCATPGTQQPLAN